MRTYKLYYATHQSNDNLIVNLIKSIRHFNLLSKTLQAFEIEGGTITKQIGFWKGQKENSFNLLIIGDYELEKIEALAIEIKQMFNQDSIMLEYNNQFVFID